MQVRKETPQSSNIAAVEGDVETGALTVEFKSGSAVDYTGVPAAIITALFDAPSVGSYYSREIRGRYEGNKRELAAARPTADEALDFTLRRSTGESMMTPAAFRSMLPFGGAR